jgi:hypothetical protein
MASKRQTPTPSPTTTVPTGAAGAYANSTPVPSGTALNSNATYQAPLGVGYQTNETGADILLFDDGSQQSYDGSSAIPPNARVFHPGQVLTTADGQPIPYAATVPAPGTEQPGITSRIEPGSPAAATSGGFTQVPARYKESDAWRVWGQLPPELQAQVKQQMIDTGLVAPGASFSLNDAINGMDQIMKYANSSGTDWITALKSMPIQPQTSKPSAANQITLSNPTDLAAIFKDAAAKLLGTSNVPQSEIDKFVTAYQASEKATAEAAQAAATAAANPPLGPPAATNPQELAASSTVASPIAGSYTATPPPTPTNAAETAIKQAHPGQYNATQMASAYDKFLSIISGGIGTPGSTSGSTTLTAGG